MDDPEKREISSNSVHHQNFRHRLTEVLLKPKDSGGVEGKWWVTFSYRSRLRVLDIKLKGSLRVRGPESDETLDGEMELEVMV